MQFPDDPFVDAENYIFAKIKHDSLTHQEDELVRNLKEKIGKWVELDDTQRKKAKNYEQLDDRTLDPNFAISLFGNRIPGDQKKHKIDINKDICNVLFKIAALRQERRLLLGLRHARTLGYINGDSYRDILCHPEWNVTQKKKQMEFDKTHGRTH